MPRRVSAQALEARWTLLQQNDIVQRLLGPHADREHYTVLYVPRTAREAYFTLFTVFVTYQHWQQNITALATTPEGLAKIQQGEYVWQEWQRWSTKLAGFLGRLSTGQASTYHPCPELLQALLEG